MKQENSICQVKRAELYARMASALGKVSSEDTLYLASFQLHRPEHEQIPEIDAYHVAFEKAVIGNEATRVKRLISVQELSKLIWIDELIQKFGSRKRFSLLLYPSEINWFDPKIAQPLPLTAHVIGQHVFIGGARSHEDQAIDQIPALHIDGSIQNHDELIRYFQEHHSALWHHARSHRASVLISDGEVRWENVYNLKLRVVKSFLKHEARLISSWRDVAPLAREITSRVFPISEWYNALIRDIRDDRPYSRFTIESSKKLELMLASWKHEEECFPHDHGNQRGIIIVLKGVAREKQYSYEKRSGTLRSKPESRDYAAGATIPIERKTIHSMKSVGEDELVTLHIYWGKRKCVRIFDPCALKVYWCKKGGAYKIREDEHKVSKFCDFVVKEEQATLYDPGILNFDHSSELATSERLDKESGQ